MRTAYYVRMIANTGREFTRCFDSAIGRELFKIDAAKLGARVTEEWVGVDESQPQKASA